MGFWKHHLENIWVFVGGDGFLDAPVFFLNIPNKKMSYKEGQALIFNEGKVE